MFKLFKKEIQESKLENENKLLIDSLSDKNLLIEELKTYVGELKIENDALKEAFLNLEKETQEVRNKLENIKISLTEILTN